MLPYAPFQAICSLIYNHTLFFNHSLKKITENFNKYSKLLRNLSVISVMIGIILAIHSLKK
jgi:hypothetical protein